jgi:iron-sulfur cluster repair protein YtfE (RIC family)
MISIDLLRRQHDAAIAFADALVHLIDHYREPDDAYRINLGMAKLLGLLRIHFAQEDLRLYPMMIESGHEEAAMVAHCFEEEMGDIAERFEAFTAHWTSSVAIAAAFPDFRREALTILHALGTRIQCENDILYPLAAAIVETVTRSAA